jgi:hypothetical protein
MLGSFGSKSNFNEVSFYCFLLLVIGIIFCRENHPYDVAEVISSKVSRIIIEYIDLITY